MKNRRETTKSHLSLFLNNVHKDFHAAKFLYSDPIEFVHRYHDPWEQEAVALLAALFAYGKVAQIRKSVEDALFRINKIASSPKGFVKNLENPIFRKKAEKVFQGFVHRFNKDSDPVILLALLNQSWTQHGSLGAHFISYLNPADPDIGNALSRVIEDWRKWLPSETPKSFHYLLTSPEDGSCCKRWCMFLRWMGRKDEIDPGLWTRGTKGIRRARKTQGNREMKGTQETNETQKPSGTYEPLSETNPLSDLFPTGRSLESWQLIMPLDTHTGRISQYLGLTSRKSLNWKAALEVTASLKKVDPLDPTRYDFALSRLGILELCQRSYREDICKKCQLLPVCQFAQKNSSQSLSPPMRH